ncbi:MAG TPA: PhzF family phenazine biosynthesis protein [Candidatus Limnocylindrales bacterium]|nr:PhzF family phenazine biosynthesis protein [Candidatus Limnocylindrales bacterium]
MVRSFGQVDVFTSEPYRGNPVAVVHDADGIDDETMQRFAAWTNLSETTFLLAPDDPAADYRVRIFTPASELPFAGHPTLGSCHAWLEAGGGPRDPGLIVQECAAGLVRIRRDDDGSLAFEEPPLIRAGEVDEATVERVCEQLRIERGQVVDAQWADNGPGWVAVLLESAAAVLAVEPGIVDMDIGVVGPYEPGADAAFEIRAFFPLNGATVEDPVTGSLNASVAGWLTRTGRAHPPYLVRQGQRLGRDGRVWISMDDAATIWVGGEAVTCIQGEVGL